MSLFDSNLKVFKDIAPKYTNERSMVIGRYDSGGNLESDPTLDLAPGYVWVHDRANPRAASRAVNLKTEYAAGYPVIVEYNTRTREDEITGADTVTAPVIYGSAAAGMNSPRKGANIPTPVTARDIVTGGLFADAANGGLYVRITSFWHSGGQWADQAFEIAPTATASSKSLVCIGIDPATNTSYTALTADRGLAFTLITNGEVDAADAADDVQVVLTANPTIYWIGAIELANGATSIDPRKIVDLHLWRYPTYIGATVSADGIPGLVPAAASADRDKYLKADGTYATPSVGSLPNYGAGVIKTLASDVASAGSDRHLIIAAQSGTADDLIEITGLSAGDEVIIRADAGDAITVKHNSGSATDKIILYNAADIVLSSDKTLKLAKTESGKVVQYVDEAGSGGLSQTVYGYNTAGGTAATMTTGMAYMKQITLSAAGLLSGITVYMQMTSSGQVGGLSAAVYTDNAGSPDKVLTIGTFENPYNLYIQQNTPQWFTVSTSKWLPAGTYWLAIQKPGSNGTIQIYYDGSGSDKTLAIGNPWFATTALYTLASTSNKYSIYADVIS